MKGTFWKTFLETIENADPEKHFMLKPGLKHDLHLDCGGVGWSWPAAMHYAASPLEKCQ